jgi:AcrR family transcriptional regulator
MDPEAVARHQRGRLEGAMVDAVARHGYWKTTLRELVALARVSKSTFYEHFEDKQDCFLKTYDDIVDEIVRRIDEAYSRPGDLRQRLTAGLGTLMDTAAEEQAAAYLVIVESLTLGAAGVPQRESAAVRFEHFVRDGFAEPGGQRQVSDLTVRAIVAGIRNCAYQRLREGRGEELPELDEPIVDWVLRYREPPPAIARRAAGVASEPAPPPPERTEPEPEEQGPRERIVRAAAELGVANGYSSLSIPAISTAAGVSNQTFYDNFPGKQEAFVAAFDAVAAEVLGDVAAAFMTRDERAEAVGVGLRALLERISGDEVFARLAFYELPAAGGAALDEADRTLGGFTGFLSPDEQEPLLPGRQRVPEAITEALGGGIWAVIQHEITEGRRAGLPDLAPEIAEFVITPFLLPDDPDRP